MSFHKYDKVFWFTLVFLALLKPLSHAEDENTELLWKKSITDFEEKHFLESSESLVRWIESKEKEGVRSPEAHENLARAYWEQKQSGPAVFHLLKATSLNETPWKNLSNLQLLSKIQSRLGIKDNWCDSLSFQLATILHRNAILFLASIAFWCLLATPVTLWSKWPNTWLWKPLIVTGSLVAGLVVVAVMNRKMSYNPAVLTSTVVPPAIASFSPSATFPLFKTNLASDTEPLADLPAGTIVNVERAENGYKRINAPVAGWIRDTDIKTLLN